MTDEKVEGVSKISKSRVVQKEYKFRDFSSKRKQWRNKDGKDTEKDEERIDHRSYVEDIKTALAYGDIGHGVLLDKKV